MRRRSLLVLLLPLLALTAGGWTWPVQGPVLQTFSFDRAHPYTAGQHRGIAIGAGEGTPVLAPASGVVSFAGTVPTSGKTITIETPSGLALSLTHLGSIAVARNSSVDEGTAVGTVGPSGMPEFDVPYVHLGVREAADDQGYLDPLAFLPVLAPPAAAPAPAPPVEMPAPAPTVAVPQPVVVPAVPAVPVALPAPVVEPPVVPVAPAVPVVDVPAGAPGAPADPAVPSLSEVPVASVRAPAPADVSVAPVDASPVTAERLEPTVFAIRPLAVGSSPSASRTGAALSSAVSPLSAAIRLPSSWPSSPGPALEPRPLPSAPLLSSSVEVPPSRGFAPALPLGLAAAIAAATLLALAWSRRRRPQAPLVRLRAVHSAVRGRLAA